MARPRKDAPAPETQLVALRLGCDLLARVDEHAKRTGVTRSSALRDLVVRGLRGAQPGKSVADAMRPAAACSWCSAPAGGKHLSECPHHPDSALRRVFSAGRRERPS